VPRWIDSETGEARAFEVSDWSGWILAWFGLFVAVWLLGGRRAIGGVVQDTLASSTVRYVLILVLVLLLLTYGARLTPAIESWVRAFAWTPTQAAGGRRRGDRIGGR